MRVIPFILDQSSPTAHHYYSPHHYLNVRTFDIYPGDTVLVKLPHHERLDQITRRVMLNEALTVKFNRENDVLGLLVSYPVPPSPPTPPETTTTTTTELPTMVRVMINAYLSQVLEIPVLKSSFVVVTDGGKIEPTTDTIAEKKQKKKKRKITDKKCSSCAAATPSPTGSPTSVITSVASYYAMRLQQQQQLEKRKVEEEKKEEEEGSCTELCDHSDIDAEHL